MMIVISKADRRVSILREVNGNDANACVDQWKLAHPGEYVSHVAMPENALPADRAQRDAWSLVNGVVVVDPTLLP